MIPSICKMVYTNQHHKATQRYATHLNDISLRSQFMESSIETSKPIDIVLVFPSDLSVTLFFGWLYLHHPLLYVYNVLTVLNDGLYLKAVC